MKVFVWGIIESLIEYPIFELHIRKIYLKTGQDNSDIHFHTLSHMNIRVGYFDVKAGFKWL